jgi:hypothetical protein
MQEMKYTQNADGSVTGEAPGIELYMPPSRNLVTIITANNPALHAELCAVVAKHYGNQKCEQSFNGFGEQLAKWEV